MYTKQEIIIRSYREGKSQRSIPANALCIMEYTGIYYLALAKYLYKKDSVLSVINPLSIKRYSQLRSKTADIFHFNHISTLLLSRYYTGMFEF